MKGICVQMSNTINFICRIAGTLENASILQNEFEQLQLKITLDGKICGGKSQVLFGLIPLNSVLKVHSPFSSFLIALYEGKESKSELQQVCDILKDQILSLQKNSIDWNGKRIKIKFFLVTDL